MGRFRRLKSFAPRRGSYSGLRLTGILCLTRH